MEYHQSEKVKVKDYSFIDGKPKTFTRSVWVTETNLGLIPVIQLNYYFWKIKKISDTHCKLVETVEIQHDK